jgi:26S proteasome regulatory subunit N5
MAKSYYAIFDTPSVQKELPDHTHDYAGKWADVLQCVVIFVLLSAHDSEQSDFMNRVASHKLLDDLPQFKALLQKFLTDEIMAMSDVKAEHETQMKAQEAVFPADNPVRVTRNPTERPLPL